MSALVNKWNDDFDKGPSTFDYCVMAFSVLGMIALFVYDIIAN